MDKTIKGHVSGILIQLQNWLCMLFFQFWSISFYPFCSLLTLVHNFLAIIKIELHLKLYLALYFSAYCDLLEEHFLSRQKLFLQKLPRCILPFQLHYYRAHPKPIIFPWHFQLGVTHAAMTVFILSHKKKLVHIPVGNKHTIP